ncbi:hypothetical protein M409DRAFT_38202 [Zasmidium cellare ATCC 36951]|uniref:Amino acid permease/ SLC12A domain-containing protein n=1 Tax=Zasmidium cellare ATCC 36951 TaxID=1080233 RepID=A0A6A6BY61_ZASCE|nr:uncharacterized protein M409DRAFT_38202 [Zasmidium cellare ATCC 36951]KAF2158492.1 hypothetical protein M409DRAFT_38202 [Zasmidium cellare ATCC 36951]
MGNSEDPAANGGQLRPRLSRLSMIGMTFAILNTWIALAGSIGLVLPSGGPVCFLYGFLFCVACNFALGASLGELAATWPTAGGQYHFAYMLSTERWRRAYSYWVGWISIAGWLMLVTTEGFFSAQFVSAAANIASGGRYQVEAWKTYLIFLAILSFGTLFNIFGNRLLGRWNDGALWWSILSVIVISAVVLATSGRFNSASYVFGGFENETGWPDGVAWILGLLQSALSLTGYDAALHMTEEMPRPSHDVPRAILMAIGIGGIIGFAFLLVILFCLVDPTAVLSTSTGMPISELMLQATGSRAAATILTLMLAVCFVNGTLGCITSASRLLFAMARDNGVLFSTWFAHINARLEVPVSAVILTFVFNACFGLLYLGPTVAFSAYAASSTIFLNMSYAAPVLVLVIRRRRILQLDRALPVGFRMDNVLGTIANWTSVLFVGVTSVFFCFPTVYPTNASTMNYVSAVIGIFVLVVGIHWFAIGKNFQGPVSQVAFVSRYSAVADDQRSSQSMSSAFRFSYMGGKAQAKTDSRTRK